MVDKIEPGMYKIVSRTEGTPPPIGINFTLPGLQSVYPSGPVQTWKFNKVGNDTYRLSVGGYPYTGVIDDKVTASINHENDVEWEITHHEYQNAYTIALAKTPHLGWTIPLNMGDNLQADHIHSFPPAAILADSIVQVRADRRMRKEVGSVS